MPQPVRRLHAFTLVELLVVIGIIALLISILMPALSRARESAQTVACLSNLRQIMTAAQMYSSENKNYMLPCGWDPTVAIPGSTATDLKNWWCNILVDNKFLVAPDSKGKGPVANSVFHCPSGNLDVASIDLTNNTAVPATRADQFGATAYRYWSVDGTTVDCWYGMNASEGDDRFHGHPARRIPANSRVGLMPMSIVKRSSETIMFFDGLIYHIDGNGNRVNARHGRLTQTNLAFYDGHAETFTTASLPGGNNGSNGTTTGAAFAVANLRAKYPPPNPVWLLDQ